MDSIQAEEIWVSVYEGADIIGYNREYVGKLAAKIAKLPEDHREIKLRVRSFGYELWLPDLIAYVEKPGRGPQRKRKTDSLTVSGKQDTL